MNKKASSFGWGLNAFFIGLIGLVIIIAVGPGFNTAINSVLGGSSGLWAFFAKHFMKILFLSIVIMLIIIVGVMRTD